MEAVRAAVVVAGATLKVAAAAAAKRSSPEDARKARADAAVTTVSAATTSDAGSGVNPSGGFTLLEMLVAMVVLSLVVLLLFETISGTSGAAAAMKRHLDMDAEARSIFDRMETDIDSMVIRQDVDALFQGLPLDGSGGTDHNDQFYFYSQAPGYASGTSGLSPLSVVGYSVTNGQLARMSMVKGWDDLPFLTTNVSVTGFNPTNLSQSLGNATNYWHVVGPSVFRMEIGLLMKSGTTNADGTVNVNNSYASLSNPLNPRHGMGNVAGIVVALALLDSQSRMIAHFSQLSNLCTSFPDCLTNSGIPMSSWEGGLSISNGIPPVVASRVRLYFRNFPLKR